MLETTNALSQVIAISVQLYYATLTHHTVVTMPVKIGHVAKNVLSMTIANMELNAVILLVLMRKMTVLVDMLHQQESTQ